MSSFESYATSFEHIHLSRKDGILEVRVHSNGGPLRWGFKPHSELSRAFREIARDRENLVMILTGTGDEFSGPRASEGVEHGFHSMRAAHWDELHGDGMELMDGLLSIQALVIGAVNGPALRHCELALLSDIVLATDTAEFQDSGHFPNNLTPGDGINVLTAMAMGITRSRYFHLTGQSLTAQRAMDFGLVNEVVPKAALMERAYELARLLSKQKPNVIRHTRLLFAHELRKKMLEFVGYGLALEGMDVADAHHEELVSNGQKKNGH